MGKKNHRDLDFWRRLYAAAEHIGEAGEFFSETLLRKSGPKIGS